MTNQFRTVVGLEVHVQLKTQSKLFCRCSTQFGASPNTQVCPVCLGLPGSLPVMNREAVQLAVRTGLALGSTIPNFTKWDRKNYFYPDLPKVIKSRNTTSLSALVVPSRSKPPRINPPKPFDSFELTWKKMQGRACTTKGQGRAIPESTSIAPETPLLEIVSEPDLSSASEAKSYLEELKLILTYLDVSDCNMQEGSLRVDANVNLHIDTASGTIATPITEIKNLNSFRAVERAIVYESGRLLSNWEKDGKTIKDAPKQTRGWDDAAGYTTLQREKEEAADYRYFPDPDLVPIILSSAQVDSIRSTLGELPQAKRKRFQAEYQLKAYDAEVLVGQGRGVSDFFEQLIKLGAPAKRASSWMQQDVLRNLKDSNIEIDAFALRPPKLAELLKTIEAGTLDTTRGKEVFQYLLQKPDSTIAEAIAALGIAQVDSSEIELLCKELLQANPDVVAKVKEGNPKALGSLVGQAKKKNPNADPRQVQDICLKLIQDQAV